MPRLSLYRSEKTNDYKFMDRTIYEMFQVGGVDVFVHKYIGPVDPSDPGKAMGETTIQDVVFLENRDRKYDTDVYTLRGVFNVQDIDFNLSQFGLFLQNDTVFMTVHINNSVDQVGRKIMSGDVLELPSLKDEYALNNFATALKKFYVVEDVNRAAEGFSSTWYPHLYRLKLKPLVDSQEFADILNRPEDQDTYAGDYSFGDYVGIYNPNTSTQTYIPSQIVEYSGDLYQVLVGFTANPTTPIIPSTDDCDYFKLYTPVTYYQGQVVKYLGELYVAKQTVTVDARNPAATAPSPVIETTLWKPYTENSLRDILSTYEKEMQLNSAILAEAEADAPLSGPDTGHYYTLAVDPTTGKTAVNSVDTINDTVSQNFDISDTNASPVREGYQGYLMGDGVAPNGPLEGTNAQFGFGIQFPRSPFTGDYFLRTDYLPNRLFRWDGVRWVKVEDKVRMTLTNTDSRQTQKTSFINNRELSGINKVAADVLIVNRPANNPFASTGITTVFTVFATRVFIKTNLSYSADYVVEAWINEDGKGAIELLSDGGYLAFNINNLILDNSRIRYSVYNRAVEQRQSVSKALRRLKPEADE